MRPNEGSDQRQRKSLQQFLVPGFCCKIIDKAIAKMMKISVPAKAKQDKTDATTKIRCTL
jgi:hypothetical protein